MIDKTSGQAGRFPTNLTRRPQSATQPTRVFPRSGWSDQTSLSVHARAALNSLTNDYSGIFNWRRPGTRLFPPPNPTQFPDARAMYGLAYPPRDNGSLPGPSPFPDARAMYGLAFPPRDTGTLPGPSPFPDARAMYGLAYPPRGGDITPTPSPFPDARAMYGLAFPPKGGDFINPTPSPAPDVRAMYGLAYPRQ